MSSTVPVSGAGPLPKPAGRSCRFSMLGLPALLAFFIIWRDTSQAAKTSLRCWALLAGPSYLRTNLCQQRQALYERLLTVGARLRDGQAADPDDATQASGS